MNLREILNPTGRRVSVGACACPGKGGSSPRPSSVGHHGLPAGHPVAIAIGDAQGRSVGQRSIPSVPRRTPPGLPRPAPPGVPRPAPPGIPTAPRAVSIGQLGLLAALRALFAPAKPAPPGGWDPGKTRTCPPDGTLLAVKGTCPPGYYYDGEFQGCLGVCVPDAWHPDAPGSAEPPGGGEPGTHEPGPVPPDPDAPPPYTLGGTRVPPAPSGPALARAMSVGHRQDGREVNHTAGLGTQGDIYRMGLTKPGGAW